MGCSDPAISYHLGSDRDFFQFGPIATRLVQAAFMLVAFIFGYWYIQRQHIKAGDLFLNKLFVPTKDMVLPY